MRIKTENFDLSTCLIAISYFAILVNPFGWNIIGHLFPIYFVFFIIVLSSGKSNCKYYKNIYMACFFFLIYAVISMFFISEYKGFFKLYLYFIIAILTFIAFTSYNFSADNLRFLLNAYIFASYCIVLKMGVQHFPLIEEPDRYTIVFAGQRMDPNFLAASLIVPTIVNFYRGEKKHFKGFSILYFLIPVIGILFTGSRGAFVSVALACFILHFYRNKNSKTKYFIFLNMLLVLFLITAIMILPDSIVSRFNVKNFYDGSNSLRLNLWMTAIKIFLTNPIMGRGSNSMLALGMEYGARLNIQSHNAFLDILADYGIIGFATIGIVVLFPLAVSIKKKNSMAIAISVGTLCCAFFLPALYSTFLWQNSMLVLSILKYDNNNINNRIALKGN